jgi:8-oxo-dGTP diphosphatase
VEPEQPRIPQKRVGAGVLLRNERGEVLLVNPTYKPGWEIPGGLVEAGESPREAAVRECQEELGVTLSLLDPVVIHYATGGRGPGDGLMFVFDAGSTDSVASEFDLPPAELSEAAFVAPEHLDHYLPEPMVRRMRAAVDASDNGTVAYLER